MTYASGQKVLASDYNGLLNLTPDLAIKAIINLFGTGNGNVGFGGNSSNVHQSNLIATSTGIKIQSSQWKNLRNAFGDCASHLGVTLPDTLPNNNLLDVGDIVTFFNTLNSTNNVSSIYNNRNTPSVVNMTTTANKLVSTRTTNWSTAVQHVFTVTFSSSDAARYFFNTGGQIIVGASRVGGTVTPQNTSWTNLLSAHSPVVFNYSNYFALTNTLTTFTSFSASSPYGANSWILQARYDDANPDPTSTGSKGAVIRINSLFNDGHTNAFSDVVSGTLTSSISERRSTGVFGRPSPTYATVIGL